MDKSGVFVGITVGSISVFIIFTALFIIPSQSDETAIQMQSQIDEINNLMLTESKTLSLIDIFEKAARKAGTMLISDFGKIENFKIDSLNKIGFSVLASACMMHILKRQRDAVGLAGRARRPRSGRHHVPAARRAGR